MDASSQLSNSIIWDQAQSPEAEALAARFEAHWRQARGRAITTASFLRREGRDQPADWLAVLSRELSLRRQAGQRCSAPDLLDRYPWLDDPVRVGLLYEDYCLREEAGEQPDPAEYLRRFPSLAPSLSRLLAIHQLVGSSTSTLFRRTCHDTAPALPEAGQTIGGFLLQEELGRGGLARVFRAAERSLADRPVVVKVARRGSDEPQTLARLQHTNIVPIFSYRVDPATGLHLLCMPYFGRVTLARLLDHPRIRSALSGADLLEILESLEPADPSAQTNSRPPSPLADLPFCHAIAWIGARLAEALHHAHEHGIIHGDIKPSNVLITADGRPMLLDFNLSRSAWARPDEPAPEALGGTFPYMAPEHLEALADGDPARIDARADVYSLGVLLHEAVAARPFADRPAPGARTMAQALRAAAAERSRNAPRLRDRFPEVPPAFAAIVRACLEPQPGARYPTAAALAADLQAFAEDRPLRYTREDFPSRARRWIRRHRVRLAVAASILLALVSATSALVYGHIESLRRETIAWALYTQALAAEHGGRDDEAIDGFLDVERVTSGDAALDRLRHLAHRERVDTSQRRLYTERASRLFHDAPRLRFTLLGFGSNPLDVERLLHDHLEPLHVFGPGSWPDAAPGLNLLGDDQVARLRNEVESLLFFGAIALASTPEPSAAQRQAAAALCHKALQFTQTEAPWRSLLERVGAPLEGRRPRPDPIHQPETESSAWACIQWGILHAVVDRDRPEQALAWLERAVLIDPSLFWAHAFLADVALQANDPIRAQAHYTAALALDPHNPWTYFGRAQAHLLQHAWSDALNDLDSAISLAAQRQLNFPEALAARAYALCHLGRPDLALRDLDAAAPFISDRPDLSLRILAGYATCLCNPSACLHQVLLTAQRLGRFLPISLQNSLRHEPIRPTPAPSPDTAFREP
ncbi:MAG: hypothetical protein KatS3mg108_3864 [Isosphaeraceae bacterium]|jgi:serine/threonine protein kinase|nr:MAG: hypothetical protein KatS3mg108_3864 [Isosphaeraceae bacterium]